MKVYKIIFITALILNLIWEYLHFGLYRAIHPIVTQSYSLFLASLWDASWITVIFLLTRRFGLGVFIFITLVFSVVVEWSALYLNFWQYEDTMPLVPLLGTGLSPTIQLAVTGYLTEKIFKL
ncbi:MAG: hypothetical protein COT91_01470 [Candidatus Doudnabacteria bacterium CG10_big_fil_rev_8_21_14_0_10_41_10]|uniref:Uncharacterized protein n=1 Tax=Candidatus Doudnabacteria bacterium CG10_big_fil_rev_8_21_14_0_10_41_10 TaxID=1974551 RepID=A0A2H0VEC4_9BACT|nr:MAG: hypothetical protein COT91_01470 [Candidatus Doudnabacteria bacterium CG10_big_fil_rev_8_21_14_0_10_41_10]